jgi:outer membrane immunogenic protein
MRRILPLAFVAASIGALITSATAADISARGSRVAPLTAPVITAYSWTGCYVGGNVGYGWAPSDWSISGTNIGAGSHDATGAVAGGQVGCDLQTSNFVFGAEGMFDWSGMSGSHRRAGVSFDSDDNWLATATGRIGLAADRALFYVKGGAAWLNVDDSFSAFGLTARANDVTRTGWTVGAGVEWAFAPAWSAKLEYDFMNFGTDTPRFCLNGCAGGLDIEQDVHLVTVGLNYRFWSH